MKKTLLIFTILLLTEISIFGQVVATVKGLVKTETQDPISYASVTLISERKVTSGTVTDTKGQFQIKGNFTGNYQLKIASVGYETTLKEVTISETGTVDIGTVILTKSRTSLGEVTVAGNVPDKTVSIEKTSINPTANATMATGSVLEVLKSSASVSIDGNGTVSIRGNQNVLILIDGVPTTLDGLGSIPAANVQNIDIITSPDVKYDAEGTGGIINIISKKQTANAFHALASFNYGFVGMLNGNLAVSYNKGRWGFRINYNGKYENDFIESELHRKFAESGNSIDQMIRANKVNSNQVVGLNVNFKASPNDILTLDFKASFPKMNNLQDFNNHYVKDLLPSNLQRRTDITFNREMFEGALSYKHLWKNTEGKGREINILASVSSITGHRPSYYYERDTMVQKSVSGGHPLILALQADFAAQVGKGKLETGLKMTVRGNNIDHKFYERNPMTDDWTYSYFFSNDLKHREYIPAVYAMYSSKINDKLSYKAGLRFEYGYVTLHCDKTQIEEHSQNFLLAPYFSLKYQITDIWSLNLGLSRRISRPSYPQLNPYVNLIDNQTYETGNIHLQPEKINKLDFGYAAVSKIVTVNGNAYFNLTQDYITQVATLEDDILVMTYMNGKWNITTGIDHTIQIRPLKWLTIDVATNTYYSHFTGNYNNMDVSNHGWVNNSNAALNFKPFKGMNIQIQYFVITPQYFPQFTTKTIHYCNIGIKQTFWKNRLTISALLTDVFNTRRWDVYAENAVYSLVNTSKNRSGMFWLGITFNFNAFKPQMGKQQKKEEDRSVIKIGE